MLDARLLLKILGDNASAKKALEDTAGSVQKVERSVGKLAVPAAAVLGGIALGAMDAAQSASELEQSYGALESVFGDTAAQAKAMAKGAATDVGLASSEYAQMSAVLGAQLKNMGADADELAGSTDALIKTGADLAATFGGPTSDAVNAVSSLLRGERDPIERYGVSIKQADINARLAAQGLDKLEGEAKRQAEAQATLAILTEQTADAQGAFVRETDTAAHASQVAGAQFENMKAALGTSLLPVLVIVSSTMGELSQWVTDNSQAATILIGVIAGLAAGIIALNVALKVYRAAQIAMTVATQAWTAVQWLLNAALTANPIGIVVVAIGALVAAFVLAYQNVEGFRNIVNAVFATVVGGVKGAVDTIAGLVGWVIEFIRSHWRLLTVILLGPFGIAVVAVIDNLDKIQAAIAAVIAWLRTAWAAVSKVLTGPFNTLKSVVNDVVKLIRGWIGGLAAFIESVFGGLKKAVADIGRAIDSLPDLPSFSLPFSAVPPAPGVAGVYGRGRGAGRAATGRVPGNVTVVVQSADPNEVMRALRRWAAANGGAPAFTRQLTRAAS